MYKQILVPIDLSDPELAKPAIANAVRREVGPVSA